MLAAIIEDLVAQSIIADEAGAEKGEGDPGLSEIDQDVVGGATRPLRLRTDVAKLLRLRIDIDEFDLVDDPIPAGQEPAMPVRTYVFHGGEATVCA
jgi:hypothetical protein